MPNANRSRTENWKQCLQQIASRGGALEIAVKHDDLMQPHSDLIWRVRLLSVDGKDMVVEHPSAVGKIFKLSLNTDLVVGMTIGQNRWMFSTRVMGARQIKTSMGRDAHGLVLELPGKVERCSRRAFYRVSTAEFALPKVECWPLLEPASVIVAETANRQMITDLLARRWAGEDVTERAQLAMTNLELPIVGPKFHANLLNISGGGLGLVVDLQHSGNFNRNTHFWVRVHLTPHVPAPLALTIKRAHSHMDAAQNVYGGFSFDFSQHPAHQKFVSEILARYVESIEAKQRKAREQAKPAA